MTHPQFDQSSPVENTLAISVNSASATNPIPENASEASRQSYDALQEKFYRRTAADEAVSTTASLRAAYVNRLINRPKRTHSPLSSYSSARRGVATAARSQKIGRHAFPKINLLGIDFDNVSKLELLSKLKRGVVFTPNVNHLMRLRRDRDFVSIYQTADYRVCDSQVLIYAARFLGKPLKAKLSGSDLFPWFCDYHRHNDEMKIFLLGGAKGVASEAQRRINARIGRQIVVGEYSPPYDFEQDIEECKKILSLLENSPANVVAVCLGAPKQERWIATYRDRLPSVDIFMAIGATVDFEAGAKPRAPKFVSELGLEWLYRLLCEPRRLWRRYLLDGLPFVGLVLSEKLRQLYLLR